MSEQVRNAISAFACLLLFLEVEGHSLPKGLNNHLVNQFEPAQHWIDQAQDDIGRMESVLFTQASAKNVIFYLMDGVSAPTITASRILKGQKVDQLKWGEEGELYIDTLPFSGSTRTFCSDAQVADSACAATALLSGSKSNFGTLGLSTHANLGNCSSQADPKKHLPSLLKWAQDKGKATGIVTNTRVTHATPAAAYAHSADRHWENDAEVLTDGEDVAVCSDIASQLVKGDVGKKLNVIFGGGRLQFLPKSEEDPESGENGLREGNENLISEWERIKGSNGAFIREKEGLDSLPSNIQHVLGLFAPSHLGYRDELEVNGDPTLEEMVESAVSFLKRTQSGVDNGFVLFVEGGRIDHAHHDATPQRALWEMIEFDKAVKKGDDLTDDEDTLIVVTSDHASVMYFAGYPGRGDSSLHPGGKGNDDLPYNTIGYANGPGQPWTVPGSNKRYNISNDDFEDVTYRPPTSVPMSSSTHGGEDVPVFAKGPFAYLLSGSNQQSYIPHAIAFAACIGDGLTHCDSASE